MGPRPASDRERPGNPSAEASRADAPAAHGHRPPERSAAEAGGDRLLMALVVVTLLFVAFVRLRLAHAPFERDEGEYAYAGQLILHGVPPYQQAYNMKFPGTYYAYALVMALFGQTVQAVRWGLLLANAASALLVHAIGRRLFGGFVAAVATVTFALMSADPWLGGVFGHATHFVLPPALAGLWLLLRAEGPHRARTVLAGGALLGAAVLVKQHAALFVLAGALAVAWPPGPAAGRGPGRVAREWSLLAAGTLLPLLTVCAVLAAQGVLESFWFWCFRYARAYVSQVPPSALVPNLLRGFERVTRAGALPWLLAAAGLAALWAGAWPLRARVLLTALLVVSFAAICPGLYFREHYFILLLPAVALLVGVAFAQAARLAARRLPGRGARRLAAGVFTLLVGLRVAAQTGFFLHDSPHEVCRQCYGRNPFVESVEIARWIRERSTPADRIAVLGSEPQICFYAGRRSATGYLYMYPLTEDQPFAGRMQDAMMREVERAHPRYLVLVQVVTSWLPQRGSARRLVEWVNGYASRDYELVGVTDIAPRGTTRYVWGVEAARYQPESRDLVLVYERRPEAPGALGR